MLDNYKWTPEEHCTELKLEKDRVHEITSPRVNADFEWKKHADFVCEAIEADPTHEPYQEFFEMACKDIGVNKGQIFGVNKGKTGIMIDAEGFTKVAGQ